MMHQRRSGGAGGKPVFSFSGAAKEDGGRTVEGDAREESRAGSQLRAPVRMAHRAVASDVTLAQLVSNNIYFSACWWIATVISTFVKTNGARKDFDDIRPIMISIFMVFEPVRLYAGVVGNLREKVPVLMGFVALSLFVTVPLFAYFWYGQEQVTAFDKALNTFALILTVAEVFTGVNAARKILASQSLAFFMAAEE